MDHNSKVWSLIMHNPAWIYTGYLDQLSNLNMHYQNFAILILGGIGVSYKIIKEGCCVVNFFLITSGLLCLLSLYLGLKTYQSILSTFLDLTSPDSSILVRLDKIGCIDWQFGMCIFAVIFFFIGYMIGLRRLYEKDRSH